MDSSRRSSTRWVDGRIVDDEPRPAGSPWAFLLSVAALILAVDLALALGSDEQATATADAETGSTAQLRERLHAAQDAAAQGRPAFVLVGDSVLAGDVMAASVPDWGSQRVVDHMRAELSVDSQARFEQVAFDGLLPIDALHLLAELDRVDPAGEVAFVLELNLRYFSSHYAGQDDCTRPELCALGLGQLGGDRSNLDEHASALARAAAGLRESAGLVHDWLDERAPVHRHRPELRAVELAAVDGLAVARAEPKPASDRAEGFARVQAHYRDSTTSLDHAQVLALAQIVDRLRARGRSAALFLTPLDDEFTRATLPGNRLGQRYAALAELIHDRALAPHIQLLDLDHPLFGADSFLDHVHLDPEGNRLLAINLLHELGLPLRERPREPLMVHDEDHDRSLVHRRGQGFADGGAVRALFRAPEGVAVSRSGDRIVIADTDNHLLRQLRGSMQIVERLAGQPRRRGHVDELAPAARFERPRSPELIGERVYVLDGRASERVREVAHGAVTTLAWSGPSCPRYLELEARDDVGAEGTLYLLCDQDRVVAVDLATRTAIPAFDSRRSGRRVVGVRGLEPTDDGRLLLADERSRIWAVPLDGQAEPPTLLFDNAGASLMPDEFKAVYPFSFAELRVNRVVGMEWVERYGALLVQDEHDLGKSIARLEREETERVFLHLLDLDEGQIYPWIKAIPHAEAFAMVNQHSQNLVSYYHFGSMAIAQDDASLVWVERARSRVLRLADGLLAAAKSGNLQTTWAKVVRVHPINRTTAAHISASRRPDRFLDRRHEPIPRAGPYVALQVGSSFSSIADRFGNYSLARWLELELQAELGYRDGVRLDLYQRTYGSASLAAVVDGFEEFLTGEGPPPDIVFLEMHDLGDGYFRSTKTRAQRLARLAKLERLAARYDTLVVFYDNSAIEAEGRDGLRASSEALEEFKVDVRKLGFVLLEPSDRLLRELLVESPWSNQPWGGGFHHGASWAVELTAKALASMAYPRIREFLRGREPARLRERDPSSFAEQRGRTGLAAAFEAADELDRDALPRIRSSYVQRRYADGRLELLVDLAGAARLAREQPAYEALALAVIFAEVESEVYGQLAEQVDVELLEFQNYDEYGEGVREAAAVVWQASYDRAQLEALIRRVAARTGGE